MFKYKRPALLISTKTWISTLSPNGGQLAVWDELSITIRRGQNRLGDLRLDLNVKEALQTHANTCVLVV